MVIAPYGFALIEVLWACFGRIDIVASAQGKIVPNDRVKTIQPLETVTVQAIHVSDGQAVKTGEVLIELDATAADADTASIANDLRTAQLTAARDGAFLQSLSALQSGKAQMPQLRASEAMPAEQVLHEQRLLEGEWQELLSKLERLEADKASRQAALRAVQATVAKLAQSARLLADWPRITSNYKPKILSPVTTTWSASRPG